MPAVRRTLVELRLFDGELLLVLRQKKCEDGVAAGFGNQWYGVLASGGIGPAADRVFLSLADSGVQGVMNGLVERDRGARGVLPVLVGDGHRDGVLTRRGIGMRHLVIRTRRAVA